MTMKRRFNETGACMPKEHYMVDISNKISKIFEMVERGQYFVINCPRQYGKTTAITALNELLKASDEYFPIKMSFEDIGEDAFKTEPRFIKSFFFRLKESFKTSDRHELVNYLKTLPSVPNFDALDTSIGKLVAKIGKKVVLIIDEVDKSSNNQLFHNFLGMLGDKYLKRDEEGQYIFHSVILAGVHNVKNLKLKLRPESEAKHNSPWNIAADFNVDMSFNPLEISTMLKQYVDETKTKMDIDTIAQTLYYYTSGYPFLVSKLCKIIDENLFLGRIRRQWNPGGIEFAIKHLLQTHPTNFENVVKNLENNKELYETVERITIEDEKIDFNMLSDVIDLGITHGIFKSTGPIVEIHNGIYKELIYDYMATNFEIDALVENNAINFYPIPWGFYLLPDGTIDFEKILLTFQKFMMKEYSNRDEAFLERNGRLIFLTFLKPILSMMGSDIKEVQPSEEKRMDVIVNFADAKFIIELKIWRGKKAHENGILQLSHYLESHGLKKGYLIIFDLTKKGRKPYKHIRNVINKTKIITVWV